MIILTLNEFEDYYYVKAVGHSGNKNESIICASISVLLETWRLTEISLEKQSITSSDGFLEAKVPKTTISQILFVQLCIGLTAIHKQYPSDISLNIGG